MLNEEQRKHMEYLATLRPDQKCDCGWAKRGECFGKCYGHADRGGAVRPPGPPDPPRSKTNTNEWS